MQRFSVLNRRAQKGRPGSWRTPVGLRVTVGRPGPRGRGPPVTVVPGPGLNVTPGQTWALAP